MRVDVLVVGAGVNGLAAAALLAGEGLSVLVAERNPWPGGLAGGAPAHAGSLYAYALGLVPREVDGLLGLGLERVLHSPEPSWVELGEDGEPVFRWWRSPERLAGEAREAGLDGLPQLLELASRFWRCFKALGLYYTWEPPSPGEAASLVDECDSEAAVFLEETSARVMERFLPYWAWGLLLYPSMYRSSGFSLAYYLQNGNVWDQPVGGMGRVAGLLLERARASGAAILLGSEVDGLLFEGGRVAGALLRGGRRVWARAVLYSGPVYGIRGLEGSERLPEGELRALERLSRLRLDIARVDYLLRRAPEPPREPGWRGVPIVVYWTGRGGGEYTYPTLYGPARGFHVVQGSGGIRRPLDPLPPGVDERDVALFVVRDWRSQEACCGNATGHPDHIPMVDPYVLNGRPLPGWAGYRTGLEGLYHGSASSYPGGEVNLVAGINAAMRILRDLGYEERARAIARRLGGEPRVAGEG